MKFLKSYLTKLKEKAGQELNNWIIMLVYITLHIDKAIVTSKSTIGGINMKFN